LAAAPLQVGLQPNPAGKFLKMPIRLDRSSADFDERFGKFLAAKREVSAGVEAAARAIVEDVAARGDAGLIEATKKFDRLALDAKGLRVTAAEVDAAVRASDAATLEALRFARDRIETFHLRQMPKDQRFTDPLGVELGWRWSAIESAGLYVPGGTAAYPSSVLMNAIPAKVAGVARLVMVVPAPDGKLNPLVLAAADLGGVSEIYRVGGAQAIAALAYGTATIAPVAKIVGPGNAYVAAAKRLVFGKVGIDMIAGPSEVLVIADDTGNADWIAADLLAQAEHDASAQSILITDSKRLAEEVERAVASQLTTLPRAQIAGRSWQDFGAIILVKSLSEAVPLANAIAAEHLEIMTADPEAFSAQIRNAGAIFLGPHTPEAIGDYVGGSNHVLPTARSARFSSGLGVLDFMKRTSILKCGPEQLRALGPAAMTLGKAEGLDAHSRSVGMRLNLP
jgi:histidinol dehydrogenase